MKLEDHLISIMCCIISVPPTTDGLEVLINDTSYPDGSIATVNPGEYNFECITGYSRPASSIKWEFGGGVVLENAHIAKPSGELTSYRSIIHGKEITASDCNIRVTCTAINEALLPPSMAPSVSVTLKVKGTCLFIFLENVKIPNTRYDNVQKYF